jgi:two-component system phosphate regulon sensor histidine kinase PhoR
VEVDISESRGWCLVAVRDHGEGLSSQDLKHLFERFYRGDPARMRSRRSGSGLGLAIVQQIAITLGGRVQATNHPEGGALLEFVLNVGIKQIIESVMLKIVVKKHALIASEQK